MEIVCLSVLYITKRIRLRHSFLQEMALSAVSIHFFFFLFITIYSFFVCSFLKALKDRRKGNKADEGVIMMIRIISVPAQVLKLFSSDCGDTAASKWNNKYSSR